MSEHGVYEVSKDKVVGVAFFTKKEELEAKNQKGLFANFKIKVKPQGAAANCWSIVKGFF